MSGESSVIAPKALPAAAMTTSTAVLSVGFETSANSSASGKQLPTHAHTFQNDESLKKHRDVGEVVAGLFTRKKKGKKTTDEHEYDDENHSHSKTSRGVSRDGFGSEASSLLSDDAHGIENG